MTVLELLKASLRLIGVLGAGEEASPEEEDDSFAALNRLIGNWSAQGLPIYQQYRETFILTGAGWYTYGPGGTLNGARPIKISGASVFYGGHSVGLKIVTAEEWNAIPDKSLRGNWADKLYYSGGFPQATLELWPAPTAGAQLQIDSLKPLALFATPADTVNFPPGYERALTHALALDLAPEYGRPITPDLANNAKDAISAIAGLNAAVLGQPVPVPAAPPSPLETTNQ